MDELSTSRRNLRFETFVKQVFNAFNLLSTGIARTSYFDYTGKWYLHFFYFRISQAKLKKHVQKNQANINASQKLTQKEKLALSIEEAQLRQKTNVMPMQNVER